MPQLYVKKQKQRWDYISFSMKYVYWWLKCSCFEFFGGKKWGVFESKSWWKYDIYSLRKIYCFDLFGNGKYGLFWAKMLMERCYLLITENFLCWTWRWWEIRSFFQPKRWWKDYIYLVFLSFPWYSGTWERWFFVQCRQASSK